MNVVEIRDLLAQVKYQDWQFEVVSKPGSEKPAYLQVTFLAPCNDTGIPSIQKGRKWTLSEWMTKSEVVSTAFKAVLTAVEHEVRETFKYKQQAIFGPHIDVDVLADLHASKGMAIIDGRPPDERRKWKTQ